MSMNRKLAESFFILDNEQRHKICKFNCRRPQQSDPLRSSMYAVACPFSSIVSV